MSASVPRLVASAPIEDVVAALREHGAVIVEGVLAPDLLARFNAEIDPILEQVSPERPYLNPALDFFYGNRVRQITGVAAHSRIFGEEILCHPFYTDVCDAILGPNCARYQLNVAQVMDRGPGAEQQLLHRDEDVWVHLPRPHAEVQVASVIALVDFTAELGATVVAPGSHRWERERQPQPEELACAEMPAGSAVVYLGSTIHAGGRELHRRPLAARHAHELRGRLAAHRGEQLSEHAAGRRPHPAAARRRSCSATPRTTRSRPAAATSAPSTCSIRSSSSPRESSKPPVGFAGWATARFYAR